MMMQTKVSNEDVSHSGSSVFNWYLPSQLFHQEAGQVVFKEQFAFDAWLASFHSIIKKP